MIYTSYFAQIKKLPSNIIPISICGKAPDWYGGLQYKKLAPKYDFFMKWKENHDNEYYIKCFKSEVLDKLNVTRVLPELQVILPYEIKIEMDAPVYVSKDTHIVLVCYEKPEDFCHRHLVADWINKNGFHVEEWTPRYLPRETCAV